MSAALAFLALLVFQEPDPTPAPKPDTPPAEAQKPQEPPKVVEPWDDARAKTAVGDLAKAFKGKPSMKERSDALDRIATGSNKLLLKPLQQIVETDSSIVIRKRAAELLANQPEKDAQPVLSKLLKSGKVTAYHTVMAEIVRGVGRCGYSSDMWPQLGELFDREYALDRVPLQEAILEVAQRHKEKGALPVLLRNLDEPLAENVHDAGNPPAEYWEARWKSWAAWRGKVKEALFAVTGQNFSTAAEAAEWLKKNPLK
ncbi:MAG: HEAT repeat domain-containing protein [Planctomycetota bacterium]